MKKKILFLSSRIPFPRVGGDRVRSSLLLTILSKHFDVHLVSISENKPPKDFYIWADKIGIQYTIFHKKKWRYYLNLFEFIFNKLPLQVNFYYFKDIKKYIDSISEDFDLLFPVLIRTASYVMDKKKPKIIEITDSIGQNYLRSKVKTKSLFWKIIYIIESKRLLDFETLCIEKFDNSLFVNREEMDFFKSDKTKWIPNIVDESLLLNYDNITPKYLNCISFFGKMDYQPNIDAVLWFVENVINFINKDLNLIIVGAYPNKKILNLKEKYNNIKITGFVNDPYEILKSSLCVVAPMQTGGGIQNKIIESMALGTINIISSIASRAIGGKDGLDYFIIDEPELIAEKINEIYINRGKFDFMKENSRNFIKDNFICSIYESNILKILRNLIED